VDSGDGESRSGMKMGRHFIFPECQTCKGLESYDRITAYVVFLKYVTPHLGAHSVHTNYEKFFVCVVPWSFRIRNATRFILKGLPIAVYATKNRNKYTNWCSRSFNIARCSTGCISLTVCHTWSQYRRYQLLHISLLPSVVVPRRH
jgi:hypothetical protein